MSGETYSAAPEASPTAGQPGNFDFWLEYLCQQGDLALWAESFEQALDDWQPELCRRLLQEARRRAGDPGQQALVHYQEGVFHTRFGDWERALRCYESALADIGPAETTMRGHLLGELGMLYRLHGRGRAALKLHQEQLRLGEQEQLPRLVAEAHDQLGLDYEALQEWRKAREHLQQALQQWQALGEDASTAVTQKNLGLVALGQQELGEAEELLKQALAALDPVENPYDVAQIKGNLGVLFQTRGDLAQAEAYYQEALVILDDIGMVFDQIGVLNNLGGLAIGREEWDQATAYFEESLALARELGNQTGARDALINLAVASLRKEEWTQARNLYAEALKVAQAQQHRRMIWHIRRRQVRFFILYGLLRALELARNTVSGMRKAR